MRFHLGLYLLFALEVFLAEEDELNDDNNFKLLPPEIYFLVTHNLESDYARNRFSLLDSAQIACVVYFLEYVMEERAYYFKHYGAEQKSVFDKNYKELEDAIALWKIKALVQ